MKTLITITTLNKHLANITNLIKIYYIIKYMIYKYKNKTNKCY